MTIIMFEFIFNNYNYIIFFIILISILVGFFISKKRHHYRIKKSVQILKKIRTFENPNADIKIINYLRKIDPFTFEELLLTAFKEAGCRIKRNKKYTGDGGIDGRFSYNRKKYYIQAKRYNGYIKNSDIIKFSFKCKKDKVKGLFIHTGKPVDILKIKEHDLNNIIIINPNDLIVFILKGYIKISD